MLAINRNNLKLIIKQVINESRGLPPDMSEEDKQDRELTWKKITDNLIANTVNSVFN